MQVVAYLMILAFPAGTIVAVVEAYARHLRRVPVKSIRYTDR